jgi:hypothetical protein
MQYLLALPKIELEIDEDGKVILPPDLKAFQKFSSWCLRILPAMRASFPEVEHFDFSPSEGYRIDEGTESLSEFLYDAVLNSGEWNERTKTKTFTRSATEMRAQYNGIHKDSGDTIRSPKLFGGMLKDAAKEIAHGKLELRKVNGLSMWTYSLSLADYEVLRLARSAEKFQTEIIPNSIKEALAARRGLRIV